ncbi:thyrotropin receptor isoform X2 [Esox lucius]|uniref:thyrotropin receptor isoform X2 n=1 Tax=Esox lucius TaxID=8010 RepID=UPI0014773DF0|nr:thyrotropin receptor isoform X2 [Esox lucius]
MMTKAPAWPELSSEIPEEVRPAWAEPGQLQNQVAFERGGERCYKMEREIVDNLFIKVIPANSFNGISETEINLSLNSNGLTDIQPYAFNGTRLDEVFLNKNLALVRLDERTFFGVISGPSLLDISESRVSSLPTMGLEAVEKLRAKNTWSLKKLPPLRAFQHLQSAELTYPSHCCGLSKLKRKRGHVESVICNLTRSARRQRSKRSSGTTHEAYEWLSPSPLDSDATGSRFYPRDNQYYSDSYSCSPSGKCFSDALYIVFPTEGPEEGFDYTLCDDDLEDQSVPCTPLPDAFNPCEDVMSLGFLRVSVWLVSLLAVLANLLVLFIMLTSHFKLTITRFLLCNLALADFCMGTYLLLIASVDLHTRSQYHLYAIDWQTGTGCQLAGALTVFACELSVYTLTAITLQRWHAITVAMRPERKLRLRHVAVLMLGGWLLCLVLAILPLAGVSSYQRVSICLPMDTDSTAATVYVVTLLVLNILAFVVVCMCYVHIYCMVHNPQHLSSQGDASMAKRMAVLIFTNFLCLGPISFFGLSAVLHRPLITVTDSKVLLVLFYPLNSCANPFLYGILTRAFHGDVLMLLSRVGLCQRQAQLYRGAQAMMSSTAGGRKSQGFSSPGIPQRQRV